MKIDKNHKSKKKIFRIMGISCLAIGIILVIISIGSFIGGITLIFGYDSKINVPLIGLVFIGIPLLFLGSVFTILGFLGDVARYQAQEVAPVGKDVINYMVDGTKDCIKTVAKSIKEGLSDNYDDNKKLVCEKCFTENDNDAKYCDNCDHKLPQDKVCPSCKTVNDYNAKYCDNCGYRLEYPL